MSLSNNGEGGWDYLSAICGHKSIFQRGIIRENTLTHETHYVPRTPKLIPLNIVTADEPKTVINDAFLKVSTHFSSVKRNCG